MKFNALSSLDPFFRPQSIAVIGASSDASKIGGRPIRYLRMAGYQGRILPINPKRSAIQDLVAYPSLSDVPGEIDLAIVAVPSEHVPQAIRTCVDKGVKAATIFSAGFAEADEKGQALQEEVVEAASGKMRVLGPNCMGTISTGTGTFATFTSAFISALPPAGRISLVSQSGAIGAHSLVLAQDRGLGINLWATTGNQSDVDISEFLAYMAADSGTDVVLACMEGVRNPERLIEAFQIARRNRKPVVMLKVGRSEVGIEAVASHTAALAGSDAAFDAVIRENNVHRANTIEEMFDIAYASSFGRYPASRRIGLLTVSGGVGILMADDAAERDLDIAALPAASQAKLKARLPFAGVRNPVDVTAQILNEPDLVEAMFNIMLNEGDYSSAVGFFAHVGRSESLMAQMIPGLQSVARANSERFLAIASLTSPSVRQQLEKAGYAVFEDPSRAVHAAAVLCRFREAFDLPVMAYAAPANAADSALKLDGCGPFSEDRSRAILSDAGIPFVPARTVVHADDAAAAANALGYPVAMKIVSSAIAHKSEIGGVILNVTNADEARKAFATLMQRGRGAARSAVIDGVLVSPMVTGGVETILGVNRDPVFGPMVMVGLGGIFVEIFKDVALARAPFDETRAHDLLRQLKGYPLLQGARGAAPADIDALVDAMTRLSGFAAQNAATIESIDVNPLVVLPKGRGVLALDALVVPVSSRGRETGTAA